METKEKKKSFDDMILSEPLVLVDFSAEWCGPCKMMEPILEEVKTSVGDKAKIVKVDVDKNIRAASQYKIMGVPTLILFRHGAVVWRQSGVLAPGVLKQVIDNHCT